MVLQKMLSTFGFEYETAQNGSIAVDKVLAQSFDLILMDIHMPNLNGIEATKTLRQAHFTQPIVALTADAFQGDQEACLNAGMNDFLSKPFQIQDLLLVIDKWVPKK